MRITNGPLLSLTFRERSARHGVFLAASSADYARPIQGAATLAEALTALRRDREAVDLVEQLAGAYTDFVEALSKGLSDADRLIQILSI